MKNRIYTLTEKSKISSHKINQDRYLFSEYVFNEDIPIRLLLVADGMGGLEDGEKAAGNAVKGFLKAFYEKTVELYLESEMDCFSVAYFIDKVEELIKKAIQEANKEVCKNNSIFRPTGTTISVVCIVGSYAVSANVGDSPVYFYRSKTRSLKLVSTLQTQAELDVEEGICERYSQKYYEKEHIIYNNLGQYSELAEEDICCCKIGHLEQGDCFLIGSDGAFGRMQDIEILELLEECIDEEEGFMLHQLFELARMDKNDDQTAIFYIVAEENDEVETYTKL